MNILRTSELKKIYGKGETAVHALDGVNLTVEKGQFLAIVGTSGSGKSTLLHMLGGLDQPTSMVFKSSSCSMTTFSCNSYTICIRNHDSAIPV